MASRKNKQSIPPIAWLLIGAGIVMAAALAFVFLSEPEDYSYRGFPITKSTCAGTEITCWDVSLNIRRSPYLVTFYNHPSDVENIPVAPEALRAVVAMQQVQNHTVYIAVPDGAAGELGVAGVALARILGDRYGIMNLNVRGAVYGSGPGKVSCSNANARTLIVTMQQQDIDAVLYSGANCVLIGATNSSRIVPVTEAFAYHVLGVIPTYNQ